MLAVSALVLAVSALELLTGSVLGVACCVLQPSVAANYGKHRASNCRQAGAPSLNDSSMLITMICCSV